MEMHILELLDKNLPQMESNLKHVCTFVFELINE